MSSAAAADSDAKKNTCGPEVCRAEPPTPMWSVCRADPEQGHGDKGEKTCVCVHVHECV